MKGVTTSPLISNIDFSEFEFFVADAEKDWLERKDPIQLLL